MTRKVGPFCFSCGGPAEEKDLTHDDGYLCDKCGREQAVWPSGKTDRGENVYPSSR